MQPGFRLIPTVVSAAVAALSCAFAASAQPAAAPRQLFISPMGEPFRAPEGQPYPSAAWFAGADADHDGALSRAEFRADALRFFKVLDANSDGKISDFEAQYYEYKIAPEIIASSFDTSARSYENANSDEVGGHHTPLANVSQGAVNYSLLGDAEPVRAADSDFNMKITQDEWMAAADRRFKILLPDGKDSIRFDDLPATPVQGKKRR